MNRIIQDSDDEFDAASPGSSIGERDDDALPTCDRRLVSNADHSLDTRPLNGTNSAELLRRDIEVAHEGMLGSARGTVTLVHPSNGLDPALDSPIDNSSKRRNSISSFGMDVFPESKRQRRKTVMTYGKTQQGNHVTVPDNGNGGVDTFCEDTGDYRQEGNVQSSELPSMRPLAEGYTVINEPYNRVLVGSVNDIPDNENITHTNWQLESTMAEEFSKHDPLALFPDPSSTIPDNTMTQQRMVEEAIYEQYLGRDVLQKSPIPVKSSIPWSTYLTSPSVKDTESKFSQTSAFHDLQNGEKANLSTDTSNQMIAPMGHQTNHVPEMSKIQSLSEPDQQNINVDLQDGLSRSRAESVDELSMGLSLPGISVTANESAKSQNTKVLGKLKSTKSRKPTQDLLEVENKFDDITSQHPEDDHNSEMEPVESDRNIHEVMHEDEDTSVITRVRERDHTPDPLNSDDAAIGLPKETYVPRPSRSRSMRVPIEEPVDYSVRPEKVAKTRNKRRKTTGSMGQTGAPSPKKLEMMSSMGFSASQASSALQECHGDIEDAVEWLCNRPPLHKIELPEDSKSTRKSKKIAQPLPETDSNIFHKSTDPICPTIEQEGIHRGALLRVEIPATDDENQAPAITSTLVEPDSTHFSEEIPAENHERTEKPPVKEKKRRGRPKKTTDTTITVHQDHKANTKTNLPETEVSNTESSVSLHNMHTSVQPPSPNIQPLNTTENDNPPNTPPKATDTTVARPFENQGEPVDVKAQQKSTKATSPAHSPLSKGKVPYRVGLSRKVRIAPLLKIVKK